MMYTELKIVESLREHTMEIINFKIKKKNEVIEKSSRNHIMQNPVIFLENNLKKSV